MGIINDMKKVRYINDDVKIICNPFADRRGK